MIKVCLRYSTDLDGAGIIFNNAMLRVFKGIGQYEDEGKLGAWIKRIVINCCIDFCKKKMIFSQKIPGGYNEEVSISPEVFNVVSGKEIQKIIAKLPAATATVFNMYVYEGFTHKQIGDQLGISDGTSKWHVSEAKRILKQNGEIFFKNTTKANAAG